MRLSDYLFGISEEQKKFCLDLKFPEDDIRKDFHGMIYDVIYNYYCGHISYELSQKISNGEVMFLEDMRKHKTHIDRLTEVSKIYVLTISYIGSLNNHLLIRAWTAFELSITTIADTVLSQIEKSELLNNRRDTHLTHVSLGRKFKKIIDKYKEKYSSDIEKDIEFIKFFGKMRNTIIHSNCIYHGKNSNYEFKGYKFRFENGKVFTYTIDENLPPRLYIDLIKNLSRVYIAVTDCLTDFNDIKYPDTNIYWEEEG